MDQLIGKTKFGAMKYIKDIDFTYKDSDLDVTVGRIFDDEIGNCSFSVQFGRNPTGLPNYSQQFWERRTSIEASPYRLRGWYRFIMIITIESIETGKLILKPMMINDEVHGPEANNCNKYDIYTNPLWKRNKYPIHEEEIYTNLVNQDFIINQIKNNDFIKNKDLIKMNIAINIQRATAADLLCIYLRYTLDIEKAKATLISKQIQKCFKKENIKKEHMNDYLQKRFDLDEMDSSLILQYIKRQDVIF